MSTSSRSSPQPSTHMKKGAASESDNAGGGNIITAVPSVPVTAERPPWKNHRKIKQAGVARANIAVSEDHPDGTTEGNYKKNHSHQTVLQQHADFFDLDHDGVLTILDTYRAFRLVGWGIILSILATLIIHVSFSYISLDSWFPDPLFRIYLRNIHRGMHGSDSTSYDSEGRFRPQSFHDLFSKYGTQGEDGEWGLTYMQSLKSIYGQRCVMDLFGMSAALFEWSATYFTIWPADGVMKMKDVRGVYDGSYFHKKAESLQAAKKA